MSTREVTISLMAQRETASSPLAEALARVGDRWTLLVVEALLDGPRRFNDLLDQLPGIAANILSERLKRLERDGLLVARPYSDRPPRAEYQLTAEGRDLAGALRLLAYWGAGHADPAQAPAHEACGTPIEARWYCPTCDRLVDDELPHDEAHVLLPRRKGQARLAAQLECSAAYSPPLDISSPGVPSSVIRPWSSTSTRSAMATVDSRWAMMTAVRPASTVRSALWTSRSLGMSSSEVASSRTSTAGAARNARANETSWRCPADSRPPRLPTGVSYPSGRAAMKSCAPIIRAAPSTSASGASGRPSLMLSATDPSNKKFSWVITMTSERSTGSGSSRRSIPSRVTRPALGSQNRPSRRAIVVLPAPVSPTSATVWPAGMSRSRPGSTTASR